jgi:hypothetical protein
MFDENKVTEKNLTLLSNTMRRGDLETRNSLLSILNNIYYELSYRNMEFIVNQMAEVDPKNLLPDEVELAFKMVGFCKFKADYPTDPDHEPLAVSTA